MDIVNIDRLLEPPDGPDEATAPPRLISVYSCQHGSWGLVLENEAQLQDSTLGYKRRGQDCDKIMCFEVRKSACKLIARFEFDERGYGNVIALLDEYREPAT